MTIKDIDIDFFQFKMLHGCSKHTYFMSSTLRERTREPSVYRHPDIPPEYSRRKLAVWMLITAMAVWLGDMSGVDPAKKQSRPHSVGLRYPIDILDANMRILSI